MMSWLMDEIYICVKGKQKYFYRVIGKFGKTIDFLLTEQHNEKTKKNFSTRQSAATAVRPRRLRSMATWPMKW